MNLNLNVINQTLRNFTVQIRKMDGTIVGTGVALTLDGKVATCAHVAREALSFSMHESAVQELLIYFPMVKYKDDKTHLARVIASFPQHDDDVILLQLISQRSPLTLEQCAVIGDGELSAGHNFQSYGYRRLDKYTAAYAEGKIVGCIEAPENEVWHSEPLQLKSAEINSGMSGAAVLDVVNNLVVGIVSQKWFADADGVDRDTAFGVNARVLSLAPLHTALYQGPLPYPRQIGAQTHIEPEQITATRPSIEKLIGMPSRLATWVGRADQIDTLEAIYRANQIRIVGLIGFGGEGKTALARETVERLLVKDRPPSGVFWWSFYERRSSDEFFEALLTYIGGAHLSQSNPSSSLKAGMIAALLNRQRLLFVLDGIEVMQHEEGDEYGLLTSNSLREFLRFFATPTHESFCLVTSRAPLLDLQAFTTYHSESVAGLNISDGIKLLQQFDVKGTDVQLEKIVIEWQGHALTLSLLGAYLLERYQGALAGLHDFTVPHERDDRSMTEAERRSNPAGHVRRILTRYDDHLTDADRAFLMIFSAFRLPVQVGAFPKIFRTDTNQKSLNASLTTLDDVGFEHLVQSLSRRGLIHPTYSNGESTYTAHPLIRSYYAQSLLQRPELATTHHSIATYYEGIVGRTPDIPTIDDLTPYIEIVYHLCVAGAYDEAWHVYWERIQQSNRFVIAHILSAYETGLALMVAFYPENNLSRDPAVTKPGTQCYILAGTGFCLQQLGQLMEADPFFERAVEGYIKQQDWRNASQTWRNLAEPRLQRGDLIGGLSAAKEGLRMARQITNTAQRQETEMTVLAYQAWAQHLLGKAESARANFTKVKQLQQRINPDRAYLYSMRGIQHADYLRRRGDRETALKVTLFNLELCQEQGWIFLLSQCQRVLGDLAADSENQVQSRQYYDEALKLARSIQRRALLIEALIARGRWYARYMQDASASFNDLNEAIVYIMSGGYRLYEADARVALAWAYCLKPDKGTARQEAESALRLSENMGYRWGQVDAKEVLVTL